MFFESARFFGFENFEVVICWARVFPESYCVVDLLSRELDGAIEYPRDYDRSGSKRNKDGEEPQGSWDGSGHWNSPVYFRTCLAEKLSGLSALDITTIPFSETVNPRLRSSSIS